MTAPAPHSIAPHTWTVADLHELPDDGYRYEIAHGSLLVTPQPDIHHADVTDRLCDLLKARKPAGIRVLATGAGVDLADLPGDATYYVSDIVVAPSDAIRRDRKTLTPWDVVLAVEVLSPGNKTNDLVLKRHDYAASGSPLYWIVDPQARTLTVLENDGKQNYRELVTVKAGEAWESDQPFPLNVDPADFT